MACFIFKTLEQRLYDYGFLGMSHKPMVSLMNNQMAYLVSKNIFKEIIWKI
jgi:hypothetical protein